MRLNSLLLTVMLAAGTAAFAMKDDPKISVIAFQDKDIFKVIYRGAEATHVKLNILNAQGGVIHSETISGLDGFIRPLNFRGLTSGHYTIEVIDRSGKFVQEVVYQPTVDSKNIHVSRIQAEPGKYLLAVGNAANEVLRVKIYDQDARLVHKEEHLVSGDFAQVYNTGEPFVRYSFEVVDEKGVSKWFTF